MCAVKSYRYRRNALYKAGYAEALVQTSNRRLLTLVELESAGQFCWGDVFGTACQEKIAIAKAMAPVFSTRIAAIKLLPKTCHPSHLSPSPSGNGRPGKVQKPNEKPLSKASQKKQQLQNQKPLTKYIVAEKRSGNRITNMAIKKPKEPRPKF